jgi:hypothetical protein
MLYSAIERVPTSSNVKTFTAQPKVIVKAGSVSLSEARAAARAAKTGHYLRVVGGSVSQRDSLWERYLGHFGGTAKKATDGQGKKAKSAKKVAVKRLKVTAKKTSAKKHSAKKASAKKR